MSGSAGIPFAASSPFTRPNQPSRSASRFTSAASAEVACRTNPRKSPVSGFTTLRNPDGTGVNRTMLSPLPSLRAWISEKSTSGLNLNTFAIAFCFASSISGVSTSTMRPSPANRFAKIAISCGKLMIGVAESAMILAPTALHSMRYNRYDLL